MPGPGSVTSDLGVPSTREVWVLHRSFSSRFSQDGCVETDLSTGTGESSGGELQPSRPQPRSSRYLRSSQRRGEGQAPILAYLLSFRRGALRHVLRQPRYLKQLTAMGLRYRGLISLAVGWTSNA